MSAYLECRSHKRNTMATLAFEIDVETNLMRLYNELCDGSYHLSPSIAFVVEEPVKREVFAADFRDRIKTDVVGLFLLLARHSSNKFGSALASFVGCTSPVDGLA